MPYYIQSDLYYPRTSIIHGFCDQSTADNRDLTAIGYNGTSRLRGNRLDYPFHTTYINSTKEVLYIKDFLNK